MKPTIACLFHQTVPMDIEPEVLVAALQEYIDHHVGPAWGVAASLVRAEVLPGDAWALVIADDADQAGVLGYHQLAHNQPIGFAFIATAQARGQHASVVASHEAAEMLVNPGINRACVSPRGNVIALEINDPVQDGTFRLSGAADARVNGTLVSNFVHPAWFGTPPPDGPYDHLGECAQPWEIRPGGYVSYWKDGRWTQMFADSGTRQQFFATDRRLRRSARQHRRGPEDPPPAHHGGHAQ